MLQLSTHPLFTNAIEQGRIKLRENGSECHLPQYIAATPDAVLPVNGISWKLPDPSVMEPEQVNQIMQLLTSDLRVDFIVLQNDDEDVQIPSGWSMVTDSAGYLTVLYRNNSITKIDDASIESMPSCQWVNMIALEHRHSSQQFMLGSVDFVKPQYDAKEESDEKSVAARLEEVRKLCIKSQKTLVLAGDFGAPFDIAKNHPTTIIRRHFVGFSHEQTDGALMYVPKSNGSINSFVLSTESRGLMYVNDNAVHEDSSTVSTPQLTGRVEFPKRSNELPLRVLEHRSDAEISAQEEKNQYPIHQRDLKSRLLTAINANLATVNLITTQQLDVFIARDSVGQRFLVLHFSVDHDNPRLERFLSSLKKLKPLPMNYPLRPLEILQEILDCHAQKRQITAEMENMPAELADEYKMKLIINMCYMHRLRNALRSRHNTVLLNLAQPEHVRFINQLCQPENTQNLNYWRIVFGVDMTLALMVLLWTLFASWYNVSKGLADDNFLYVEKNTTPAIAPAWILGTWFLINATTVYRQRDTCFRIAIGMSHVIAFAYLIGLIVWGMNYQFAGMNDSNSFAYINAVVANVIVVITACAVLAAAGNGLRQLSNGCRDRCTHNSNIHRYRIFRHGDSKGSSFDPSLSEHLLDTEPHENLELV